MPITSSVRGGANPRCTPANVVTREPTVCDRPMPGITCVKSVLPVAPFAVGSWFVRSNRTCSTRTPGVTVQSPKRKRFKAKAEYA
jgi:hypothetical protein